MLTKTTKLLHKRGIEANIPTLDTSEIAYTTDSHKLYVGSEIGNIRIAAAEELTAIKENAATSMALALESKESVNSLKKELVSALDKIGIEANASEDLASIADKISKIEMGVKAGAILDESSIEVIKNDGMELVQFKTGLKAVGKPTVDKDGCYYVSTSDAYLIKFDADGNQLFKVSDYSYATIITIEDRVFRIGYKTDTAKITEFDKNWNKIKELVFYYNSSPKCQLSFSNNTISFATGYNYVYSCKLDEASITMSSVYASSKPSFNNCILSVDGYFYTIDAYQSMYKYDKDFKLISNSNKVAKYITETKGGRIIGVYESQIRLIEKGGYGIKASVYVFGELDTVNQSTYNTPGYIEAIDPDNGIYASTFNSVYVEFKVDEVNETIEILKKYPLMNSYYTAYFGANKDRRCALVVTDNSVQVFDYNSAILKVK